MVHKDPEHQQRRASYNTGGQLNGGHTHQYCHREIEWAVDKGKWQITSRLHTCTFSCRTHRGYIVYEHYSLSSIPVLKSEVL